MYNLDIKPEADKIFSKLAKKNIHQLRIINKKIQEIRLNPKHEYKFLRTPLQNYNRIHIDTNFVLILKINHKEELVEIYYYAHHDDIYKWGP
jgi:mRNA-degrading endonuclease RelE of RelBE toxin-antitoxin system